jgi:hypothetical protein
VSENLITAFSPGILESRTTKQWLSTKTKNKLHDKAFVVRHDIVMSSNVEPRTEVDELGRKMRSSLRKDIRCRPRHQLHEIIETSSDGISTAFLKMKEMMKVE